MVKFVYFLILILLLSNGCVKPTNSIEECETKAPEERDDCYYTFAITENDVGRCTQIIDDAKRNNCINSFSD